MDNMHLHNVVVKYSTAYYRGLAAYTGSGIEDNIEATLEIHCRVNDVFRAAYGPTTFMEP